MATPSRGSIVLIPFPFSDLSQSKLRPSVVLAPSGKGDWILCQVTSKRYIDTKAVELSNQDFKQALYELPVLHALENFLPQTTA